MQTFKDNFSKQADIYAKYRPHYPSGLYSYLASLTSGHERVWDCGTGNGQAAIGLAEHYSEVIATDPSDEQIKNAMPHPRVNYKREKAEDPSIDAASVDLVTVANALHWFDFDAFYEAARRVLKKNGVIAAWAYLLPSVSPELDTIIEKFHYGTLNDYWLSENRLVEKKYTTIPFPFQEIGSPEFLCEKTMTLDDLVGYLNTWSATQRFIRQNGMNPTEQIREELQAEWANASQKRVTWRVFLKVGKYVG
jgi:SAM-dependent methyltransferase